VLRLHDNLSSGNGYKARLLLAQLAIPFERVEYDIDSGETRTPEFLGKVNPNGKVPVLETEDGRFLPESTRSSATSRRAPPSSQTTASGAPRSYAGCSSSSTVTSPT
jgi:hypothetical protein